MFEGKEVKVLLANAGSGKGNWTGCNIRTTKGIKKFGELKEGDYVYDRYGKPTKVLAVYPRGYMKAYKVTLSDGRSTIVSLDHLWTVYRCTRSNKKETISLHTMLKEGIHKSADNPRFYIPQVIGSDFKRQSYIEPVPRIAIEDVTELEGEYEINCIYVDNIEHLYQVDDGIVTHNTTRLIDYVEEELKTLRPEEIGFVTFTRKGADEGLTRVCNKYRLEASDVPYFKTLHSLTYHALDLKTNQMFSRLDQKAFNKKYGYYINRCEVSETHAHPTKDTLYLDYYDLERSGALRSKQIAESDIDLGYYHSLVQKYEDYKACKSLVDFFDCLIKYVQEGDSLPCKVVMIDEAQDVTALQWKVIEKAFANAERVYIAGDDKQSLFTYSGARPDILIEFSKKYPVEKLAKSYRIPMSVYKLAKAMTAFIGEKTDLVMEPREENGEGSITRLSDLERLTALMEPKLENAVITDWYILVRNQCYLDRVASALEDRLIPYWTSDGFFMGGEIMKRLVDYRNFSLEGYKSKEKKEAFAKKYGITDFSKPFTDTNLFSEGRKWIYQAYIEHYGFETLKEMCKWKPVVLISTVHSVKGGEANNIAFLMDNTRRVRLNIYNNIDEELRVLYVAITRTRTNLYLIDSKDGNGYDGIFQVLKEEYNLDY